MGGYVWALQILPTLRALSESLSASPPRFLNGGKWIGLVWYNDLRRGIYFLYEVFSSTIVVMRCLPSEYSFIMIRNGQFKFLMVQRRSDGPPCWTVLLLWRRGPQTPLPSASADCAANLTGEMVAVSGHDFGALGDFERCVGLPGAKYCTVKQVCTTHRSSGVHCVPCRCHPTLLFVCVHFLAPAHVWKKLPQRSQETHVKEWYRPGSRIIFEPCFGGS